MWKRDQIISQFHNQMQLKLQFPHRRRVLSLPWCRLRFIVMDTETTGLDPTRDRVISLGGVLVKNNTLRLDQTFNQLVNPQQEIPSKVTLLTGIDMAATNQAPTLLEVLPAFLDFAQDAVLVGCGLSFDLAVLNRSLAEEGLIPLPHPALDLGLLSRVVSPHLTNHSLDALLTNWHLPPLGRHSALGDALLAARLLPRLLRKARVQNITNLNQFYRCIQSLRNQANG